MSKTKPMQVEMLSNDDGPCILVRGSDLAECVAIAKEEAVANDLRMREPAPVSLSWWRKIPCPGYEHEVDGCLPCAGFVGGSHLVASKPGRGAFQGIVADLERDGRGRH